MLMLLSYIRWPQCFLNITNWVSFKSTVTLKFIIRCFDKKPKQYSIYFLALSWACVSFMTWLQRPTSFLSHIVASLINNLNSRHVSAFALNIPVVCFMSIKSRCFRSSVFNNGSFLARRAVSQQSALLGPTAGCAVLIIHFADECRFCSPLIYFSLVHMHVGTCIFLSVHVVTFVQACGL